MWDWLTGLFGKKKKIEEEKSIEAQNSQRRQRAGRWRRDEATSIMPKITPFNRPHGLNEYNNAQNQKIDRMISGFNTGTNEEKITKINTALDFASDSKRPEYSHGLFGSRETKYKEQNDKIIKAAYDSSFGLNNSELSRRLANLERFRTNNNRIATEHNKEVGNLWSNGGDESRKPGFFDYLNPFGRHGLYGDHSGRRTMQKMVKPAIQTFQNIQATIDSTDKNPGFQWTDPMDYGRFALKLIPGMAQGIAEVPEKISEGISGRRIEEDGTGADLDALQRIGSVGDAAITVGGLPIGASGTVLKGVGLMKTSVKQAAKQGAWQTIKSLAKNAVEEGIEEVVQTFFEDLSDNGKLNAKPKDYTDAFALGTLGGAMMEGGGRVLSVTKNKVKSKIDAKIDPMQNPVSNAMAKVEAQNEIRYKLDTKNQNFSASNDKSLAGRYYEATKNELISGGKLAEKHIEAISKILGGSDDELLEKLQLLGAHDVYDYTRDGERVFKTKEKYLDIIKENLEEKIRSEEFERKQREEFLEGEAKLEESLKRTAEDTGFPIEVIRKLYDAEQYRERSLNSDNLRWMRNREQHISRSNSEGGYDMKSEMSNRAVEAMMEGKYPIEEAAKRLGVSEDAIEALIPPSEWHHVGKEMEPTFFYDISGLIGAEENLGLWDGDPDYKKNGKLLKKLLEFDMNKESIDDPENTPSESIKFKLSPEQEAYFRDSRDIKAELTALEQQRYELQRKRSDTYDMVRKQNPNIGILEVGRLAREQTSDINAQIEHINAKIQQLEPIIEQQELLQQQIILDKRKKATIKTIDERISDYDLDTTQPVYHGTSHEVAPEIRRKGLLAGSELEENTYRGGGHGEIQGSISLTPNKKVAENFALNDGRRGVIVETGLKDNPRIVQMEGIDYAEDLNQYIPELRKRGIDGVWLDGEDEIALINKNKLTGKYDITGLDGVKYKLKRQKVETDFSEQSLRKIIGEEYDIVTKTPDGNTRNAQGYADLKNGIVAILDGKMDTANHEATHIAIYTLKQTNPKLADNAIGSIIRHYGAEELVNSANKAGYGDTVGHKLDFNNEADVRYAAEEQLANDFAKYAEAKAKGRENYYAKKTNMPAQIKAWFDYAIEYLKDMVGRLDSAHNFMYKLERGDYAQMIDQQVRTMHGADSNVLSTRPQMAYKIDPETNIVHIDNNIIAGVPKSQILSTIKKYLQDNLQGKSYDLNYGKDGEAKINAKTTNKLIQPDNNLTNRGRLVGDLPDILKVSQKISEAADSKNHSFAKDGFEYRRATVEVGGKYYDVKLNIGIGNNGKLLYTINGIKESSLVEPNSPSRWELYDSNIPQDPDNVKRKLTDTTDMETVGTKNPDLDVDEYVDEQVKAQKKAEKVGFIQKLKDKKALAKHHLIDDAVDYERYMTKEQKKSVLRDEIRNDIDKVRSSDMIAQQFIRDNGLAELGKLSTEELNQFQQYLIARRHAADLHKKGIKTGRDLDADLAIIDKYKKKFTNEEKIYRNFNKKLLQYMEDNGLISKELHTELNKNTAYTPYQRLMDDVSGFTGHSQQLGNLSSEQVIKGIKGSERTILNPIEATMANTMRIINEGQRNIAARKIAENVFSENILKEGQKPRAGYDTLNFMQDGKKVTYEVPQLVASEMKRLNRVLPDGVDKVVKVLSMPAKSLRAGATSLNPMFAVSNLFRDQLQTTVTGNLKTNFKGSKKALIATFVPGEKANALRAELRQQGIIGSEYRQTYGYKQGDLIKELQKEHQLPRKAWDRIKHPIDALNDLIGRTEYFTRAQQYFGTDGDVVAKSQAARNNTLNFSRGGSTVMVLNKIVPFLNAGVQGGRQITNQFAKRPVHTTLALTAWAGAALAAKGICNTDEDKKELYDRVSDYEKRTNLILFGDNAKYNPETGRVDELIKIPIPQFLYPITDAMNNLKGEPEDLLKVAGNIFEVFTGIDAENPVNQLTPTAVKPFIEAATNTNTFTGREIVSKYDKDLRPDEKGSKYTTGVARFMSSLTGVDAPVIDNFIQSWSGGLGKDLAKTLTDNPDNSRDGGGIGKIFTEGTYRRFGSAGASSQYEIASAKGEEMKKALKSDPEFMNLSKDERNKIMRAIDNDSMAIGGALNKAERGEEAKKGLSDRQEQMFNGMNVKDYSQQVLDGSKSVNKKRLYSEPDYEYNEFKKKHDKKLKKGEYSKKQKIEATKKLNKLKAGKDFTKETRDLYELDKSDFYNLVTKDGDGNRIVKEVLAYGDALVAAGIFERNKFRDRYGKIEIISSKGGGKRGRGRGAATYKMDTMALIRGALKASSGGKLAQLSKRKYTTKFAPRAKTVAVKRLGGKFQFAKK